MRKVKTKRVNGESETNRDEGQLDKDVQKSEELVCGPVTYSEADRHAFHLLATCKCKIILVLISVK